MPAAKTQAVSITDQVSFTKVKATNAAETSFTAPVMTNTKPANDGVVNIRRQGSASGWIRVLPYGTGDADDVFEMWITGWNKVVVGSVTTWIPARLVKLTCTMSTFAGIASGALVATDLVCDTITATGGISNVSYELYSPTDNTPAFALVKVNGYELIEFTFDATTGNPTGMNCLWARL